MKRVLPAILAIMFLTQCAGKRDEVVIIYTPFGEMTVVLFDQTPKHKENFLKLASEGSYDSTIFHRVIKDFMVQGGDMNLSEPGSCDYTIPAEFVKGLVHAKGAVAAARMGDQVNPEKESSGCQFYIVDGNKFGDMQLEQLVKNKEGNYYNMKFRELLGRPEYQQLKQEIVQLQQSGDRAALQQKYEATIPVIDEEFGAPSYPVYTEEQKETYAEEGGSPHLDGDYTVFGQVVSGLDVIDSLAAVRTGRADKPLNDIHMTMEVKKMSRKKIEKEFGINYPESAE